MIRFRSTLKKLINRMKHNSCDNLIWIINFLPNIAGLPLLSRYFNPKFWIIHTVLLFYVYIVGTIVYQLYFADGFLDTVNSFFNIYIFILVFVTSWWLLQKRNDLNEILRLVKENDDLVVASNRFIEIHQKMLKSIKKIVMLCYMFHFINDIIIFIPSRTIGMDDFSTVSCFGLEPLTSSPNRQICMAILAAQELTAIVTVGSYDVILIFLFAHTTMIFDILTEEMKNFEHISNEFDGSIDMSSNIKNYLTLQGPSGPIGPRNNRFSIVSGFCGLEGLKNMVKRHSLALRTVKKLQEIYATSIGLGFGLDALCLCLFFVLPLDICLNFAPLIYHCLFVFFLYCLQGQRLTSASEKFEMAVYCSGWENLRVQEQKHTLLMLKMAQNPIILYAAGVVPIRIYTFANTMQTIYKFVTVFRV